MTPLSQAFVDLCPVENGFRLRGKEMTRIEVFVDAAFAFAVTMLVISFDHIPENYEEIVAAIQRIPAFVLAVVQMVWIWYEHAKWSKRYGLDSAVAVTLSTALLIVMLVYIYPLRIMVAGMLRWFTGGYLPSDFSMTSYDELAGMFVFMGIGFSCMCLIFNLMYRYAAAKQKQLRLSAWEQHETLKLQWLWAGMGVTGLLAALLALLLDDLWVPFAGFAFSLMGVWTPLLESRMRRRQKTLGLQPHVVTEADN